MANKSFYIDFIRQIIEQTLLEEHIKNPNLVGGDQLGLFSFYEQLEEQDEVDRYVEKFNDLAEQQNRTNLIANGIISSPENPTITNLNKDLVVPLSFLCSFRVTLKDRDLMLDTINNLINIRKGRKVDIAEFDNGKLFAVGTIGNNVEGDPQIKIGDYIGHLPYGINLNTFITSRINYLYDHYGFSVISLLPTGRTSYLYYSHGGNNILKVARLDTETGTWKNQLDDGKYTDIIYPPSSNDDTNTFTKYKVSMSFDAVRCETPRTLNGEEVINISFRGNATIVSENVMLGNDLTKLAITKYKLIKSDNGSADTTFTAQYHYLEPLEISSGSSVNTEINRLMSNKFVANTHSDSLEISTKYTFLLSNDNTSIINKWFEYARYGVQTDISPNIIYRIKEYYISWGNLYIGGSDDGYLAKIVDNMEIENTESDTMTISVSFQVQGANN